MKNAENNYFDQHLECAAPKLGAQLSFSFLFLTSFQLFPCFLCLAGNPCAFGSSSSQLVLDLAALFSGHHCRKDPPSVVKREFGGVKKFKFNHLFNLHLLNVQSIHY